MINIHWVILHMSSKLRSHNPKSFPPNHLHPKLHPHLIIIDAQTNTPQAHLTNQRRTRKSTSNRFNKCRSSGDGKNIGRPLKLPLAINRSWRRYCVFATMPHIAS